LYADRGTAAKPAAIRHRYSGEHRQITLDQNGCLARVDRRIRPLLLGSDHLLITHSRDVFHEVRIRNNSRTDLTAFAVKVRQMPRGGASGDVPLVLYCDPVVDVTAKPLPAGEERLVTSSNMICCDLPPVRTVGRLSGALTRISQQFWHA
jgi:hypothetical protein